MPCTQNKRECGKIKAIYYYYLDVSGAIEHSLVNTEIILKVAHEQF